MIQIDMEMPDSCLECWFLKYDIRTGVTSCIIKGIILARYLKKMDFEGRHEKCSLVEVLDNNVADMDSINRQAAIKAFDGEIRITGEDNYNAVYKYIRNVSEKIRNLPSAQPQQKKGKWISIFDEEESKCSKCGKAYYYPKARRYYFCPNCGADMRGEQNER